MRNTRRAVTAVAASVALALTASPALASHFRASTSEVEVAGNVLTWQLVEAWAKDDLDAIISSGSDVEVTDSGGNVVAVPVTDPVDVEDLSNPLFDVLQQTVDLDLTGLAANPGSYQAYVSNCCRIGDVENTSDDGDMSQAIGFTVRANGSVNRPPAFNKPSVYTLIPFGAGGRRLVLDYRATDPEGQAVTYRLMTDRDAPDYGADRMPCSQLRAGVFTLAPGLCTGGDVFGDIYQPGTFWAVKVRATDSTGNHSETDTLLRVPVAPDPYFADISVDRSRATFGLGLDDLDTFVDQWEVVCTNQADPTDVRSAQGTTPSLVVEGLRPVATYDCVATATNGLGSGTDTTTVVTEEFAAQTLAFPPMPDVALARGSVLPQATASSGLPVSYVSRTPRVCGVQDGRVVLQRRGVCTIEAQQEGDSNYGQATPISRSFRVSGRVVAVLGAPARHVGAGRVPTVCRLKQGPAEACRVVARAKVGDRWVIVGRGASAEAGRRVQTPVALTPQGRRLAARPAGVVLRLSATVRDAAGGRDRDRAVTRVVAPAVRLAPVYFATDSARVPAADAARLARVRERMGRVAAVVCTGYTDSRAGRPYNKALARDRAQAVCDILTAGRKIRTRIIAVGEDRLTFSNATPQGRAKNRRSEAVLRY